MIDHLVTKVSVLALAAGATVATVSGISGENVEMLKIVVGSASALVAGTWGILVMFDSRVDRKIKSSEKRTIREIHHLRDLMVERGLIRSGPIDLETEE